MSKLRNRKMIPEDLEKNIYYKRLYITKQLTSYDRAGVVNSWAEYGQCRCYCYSFYVFYTNSEHCGIHVIIDIVTWHLLWRTQFMKWHLLCCFSWNINEVCLFTTAIFSYHILQKQFFLNHRYKNTSIKILT